MGSENRGLWKVYGIGCSRDSDAVVSIEHPIRLDDRFFFLPDPVHLFKNIHIMLNSNKIIFLPPDILCSEKLTHPTVEMQHIDDVLEFELNVELKVAHRLKKTKLHCKNGFEKMKVGTARSVFNRRTEIARRRYAEHTGNAAYNTTAFFVGLVSRWFDLMSNRALKLAIGLKNVAAYEEAINHISKTAHVFRFMTIGVDEHWKPCQTGVIMACECMLRLQDYFLKERSYQFLLTSRFCQCYLENIFSAVRVRQPLPNPLQVKQNLRVIVLSQLCTNSINTSYENDDADIEEI
ncbi:hypothetical protein DMN91_011799 [Ooceraea biroi]|uniref:Transposable element P transposase n=1 Tax=Ooceraea biroi TaxID=2015173 RepID=A0A3L8D740_OOCBI|nr:hypothetical protein DMN91_011799 [Ooceraea biroi]